MRLASYASGQSCWAGAKLCIAVQGSGTDCNYTLKLTGSRNQYRWASAPTSKSHRGSWTVQHLAFPLSAWPPA